MDYTELIHVDVIPASRKPESDLPAKSRFDQVRGVVPDLLGHFLPLTQTRFRLVRDLCAASPCEIVAGHTRSEA